MKKLILFLLVITILSGCKTEEQKERDSHSHNISGTLTDVKLVDKEIYLKPYRCAMTFEKNGERIVLFAHSKQSFDALQKHTTMTVEYSSDFFIEKVTLTGMEGTTNDQ